MSVFVSMYSCLLDRMDECCCLLVCVGVCCCLMVFVVVCWCVGVFGDLLVIIVVCWCMLVFAVFCWCLLLSISFCCLYVGVYCVLLSPLLPFLSSLSPAPHLKKKKTPSHTHPHPTPPTSRVLMPHAVVPSSHNRGMEGRKQPASSQSPRALTPRLLPIPSHTDTPPSPNPLAH